MTKLTFKNRVYLKDILSVSEISETRDELGYWYFSVDRKVGEFYFCYKYKSAAIHERQALIDKLNELKLKG